MRDDRRTQEDLIFQNIEEKERLLRQAEQKLLAGEAEFMFSKELYDLARAWGVSIEEAQEIFMRMFEERRRARD